MLWCYLYFRSLQVPRIFLLVVSLQETTIPKSSLSNPLSKTSVNEEPVDIFTFQTTLGIFKGSDFTDFGFSFSKYFMTKKYSLKFNIDLKGHSGI